MVQFKITTNDNPFDPFDNFEEWWQFDIEKGYDSCSKLDRIVKLKDEFSALEISKAIEIAIDSIVKYDFTDTYKKASREYAESNEIISEEELGLIGIKEEQL